MDKDPILRGIMAQLGDFGRYQLSQHLLHLLAPLLAGVHMISLTFTAPTPDHRCFIPQVDSNNASSGNLSQYIPLDKDGNLDKCKKFSELGVEESCNDMYWYDPQYYKTSRVIEWNLVCDKEWIRTLLQSIYMLGVLFGAVILGGFADTFGRKPIFCASGILQLVFGVACAFMTNYYSYAVMLYFYGAFGSGGAYVTGFVLSMELIGSSKRTLCGVIFSFMFAVGMMLVSLWGWLIPDVTILQLVLASHSLLLIGHWWLIDESIRWLWGKGRNEEALKIASKAARINGKQLTRLSTPNLNTNKEDQQGQGDQVEVREEETEKNKFESEGDAERQEQAEEELGKSLQDTESRRTSSHGTDERIKYPQRTGIIRLFTLPHLRLRIMIMAYFWFANSMGYYGLNFNVANLPGNPFLMFFLNSLAEVPGYIFLILFLDRTGRRLMASALLFIGGFACLCVPILNNGLSVICLCMVAKVAVAGSFAACYIYSAELFPTAIRNSVMGITTMAARGAGTLAPQIILLKQFSQALPMIIFGSVAVTSAFLALFLPETLNRHMPQTIEEGENFGKGDTAFQTVWRFFKRRRTPTATRLENGTPDEMS